MYNTRLPRAKRSWATGCKVWCESRSLTVCAGDLCGRLGMDASPSNQERPKPRNRILNGIWNRNLSNQSSLGLSLKFWLDERKFGRLAISTEEFDPGSE